MRVTRDIDPSEIRPGVDGGDFRPPPPIKKKRRWWLRILLLLVVLGGGAYSYVHFGGKMPAMLGRADGEPPVIKADATPVKVKPDNPGGAEIPDRDKLVYQRMSGTPAAEPKVERLLPAPEAPLAPPAAPMPAPAPAVQQPLPKVPTEAQVDAATVPAPAKVAEPAGKVLAAKPVEPPPPPPAPVEAATVASNTPKAPPAAPAPAPAEAEAPRPLAAKMEAAKETPKASAPAAFGAYQIQIAAVRQEDIAKREWTRLQRVHPDLLGDLNLIVVRADLGAEKGVFYRLRAGPLASEASARKRCADLAKVKVGCLVVKARE